MSSIRTLVAKSRQLYGKSRATRNLRRQWILKTQELESRGIHLIKTGKFPGKIVTKADQNYPVYQSRGLAFS